MKTEITYSCGHKGIIDLYGDKRHKERQLWMAENKGLCPDCIEKQEQERLNRAEASGFPELVGSDKQIKWATDIRDKAVAVAKDYEAFIYGEYGEDGFEASVCKDAVAEYFGHEKANFWIDNRDRLEDALTEIAQDIYDKRKGA